GLRVSVDAGVGYRGSNLVLNGNYRSRKMGFSLGGWGRANYNISGRYENEQITNDTILNLQSAATRNNGIFGRYQLGWDYDINKYNYMTASVRYGVRNFNNYQDDLSTVSFINDVENSRGLRDVKTIDQSGTVDVNLDYTHTSDTPQKEWTISTQYSRNNRDNDFTNIIYTNADPAVIDSRLKNENDSYNEEMTLQFDYQTPVNKNQLIEFGAKDILRKVSSDYQTFSAIGSDGEFQQVVTQGSANVFNYEQNITAGYFSYTLSTQSAYSIKAGARYEYTTITADFTDNSEEPDPEIPSYGVLVPSINVSRRLKNNNTIKAAYNRRIHRPSIQFLNPNIQAANPLSRTIGNPNLEPEYTNNYELSYSTSIKGTSLNFSAFVRNTTGEIESFRTVVQDSIIETRYANVGLDNAYGLNIFANINIGSKFSLNGGTDVFYSVMDNQNPNADQAARNEGWVASGRIFGSYTLSKGWGFQFFGFMRGGRVQLQGFQGGFGMYSLSLKKDFNNKRGSLGFGFENFLTPSFKIRSELNSPTITQQSLNEMRRLSFRVNISYRFGKMSFDQPRRRSRSVNNDDLKDGSSDGMNMGGDGQQQNGGNQPRGGGMPVVTRGNVNQSKPASDTKPDSIQYEAAGTWNYTLESPQGGNGTLVITKSETGYSGTIKSNRMTEEAPLTSITVNGNEVTYSYSVNFGGNMVAITSTILISKDEMSGTMSVGQFGSFPIKGTRKIN
ncbi:MAG: outer membrane beta-barrel family protein, partial [Flammeovirgaceae bacterium]|nr:outer membrane beta-barrel family protein [Flammeovirgaceae bacterium]